MILIQNENHGMGAGISHKLPKVILIGPSVISYFTELSTSPLRAVDGGRVKQSMR